MTKVNINNAEYHFVYIVGSANFGNNRATCFDYVLKSAKCDYDQRHVIALRPVNVAARSWSYDNEW